MTKSSIQHKYVAWRDGRPRFSPGPELRAAGHKGKDLRHDDGRWFSKGECVDWSAGFIRALAAPKKAAPRKAGQPALRYTVAQMFEDLWRSPKFRPGEAKSHSPATVRDYKQRAGVIEKDHPLIWNAPVDDLRRPHIFNMYEELWQARGLSTARQCVLTLSTAISGAMRRGKARRTDNPCLGLKMETPDPRIRFATRAELAALIAAADACGRPEIADAIVLAVWTGQRQGDRLALTNRAMRNGRRIFRQSKTGAIVEIRDVPDLAARIEASTARRAAARATALLAANSPDERATIEHRFSHTILDEKRWVPFLGQHYTHTFQSVRELAVAGLGDGETPAQAIERHKAATAARPASAAPPGGQPAQAGAAAVRAWTNPPCPSLADFRDQDLRDTAVTWMALARATIPEIISVTGHTAQSATMILKHYLARHPEMADSAIGKLLAWYDGNGETEIGL